MNFIDEFRDKDTILAYARLAGIGHIAGKYVPSEKNVSADDSAEEN